MAPWEDIYSTVKKKKKKKNTLIQNNCFAKTVESA